MPSEMSLEALEDRRLEGGYRLHVETRKSRYIEQSHFGLYLKDEQGNLSKDPVFKGTYSLGRRWIEGWIDGDYYEEAVFPKEKRVNLSEKGIDGELFKLLGGLIPPGGSLMIAYEMFSGEGRVHKITTRALETGIPPVATPLGYLLFKAGCWAGFKDWYIAEGGREGPKKLQGFKALDGKHTRRKAFEIVEDLKSFLDGEPVSHPDLEDSSKWRAEEVLGVLQSIIFEE